MSEAIENPRVHATAEVSAAASLGPGCVIWNQAQVREGASIGAGTIVAKNCYIDAGVLIGERCKIQNNVSVFHGVTIGDGVFVGPHVCFTNDRVPRAINPDGTQKGADDWTVSETTVEYGASIGAGVVVLPGVAIGRFAMIGAGSVVTHDVPANALVLGNPARVVGWVCDCGNRVVNGYCPACGRGYPICTTRTP